MHLIQEQFEQRNIEFEYFENREDLSTAIENEIKSYDSIGIGNSKTLKALKVTELATSLNKTVYDKTLVSTIEDIKEKKRGVNGRMLYIQLQCFNKSWQDY